MLKVLVMDMCRCPFTNIVPGIKIDWTGVTDADVFRGSWAGRLALGSKFLTCRPRTLKMVKRTIDPGAGH